MIEGYTKQVTGKKLEAETSLNFYRSTQRYNPEGSTRDSHRYQNLKSNEEYLGHTETGSRTRKQWLKPLNIWQHGWGGNQVNFKSDKEVQEWGDGGAMVKPPGVGGGS
jgi:hypothetical protein